MNKRGSTYLFYVFLLIALSIGYAVSVNPNFDINGFKNNLNWSHIDIELNESPDLGNALESIVNGLGEGFYSIMKWVAEISKDYPQVPFKFLIVIVIISILSPILINIFRFSIIVFILTKEMFQKRKDKKRLNKLKITKAVKEYNERDKRQRTNLKRD